MIERKTWQVVLLETRPNLPGEALKVLNTEYFVGKSGFNLLFDRSNYVTCAHGPPACNFYVR